MKRIFYGQLPEGYKFFQNILFDLVNGDGHGIEQYKENEGQPNGQKFKVTIKIERVK